MIPRNKSLPVLATLVLFGVSAIAYAGSITYQKAVQNDLTGGSNARNSDALKLSASTLSPANTSGLTIADSGTNQSRSGQVGVYSNDSDDNGGGGGGGGSGGGSGSGSGSGTGSASKRPRPALVPEPTTIMLLGTGITGAVASIRKRNKKSST